MSEEQNSNEAAVSFPSDLIKKNTQQKHIWQAPSLAGIQGGENLIAPMSPLRAAQAA